MDTDEDTTAVDRKANIERILSENNISCNVLIIPPIASVNWGRKVGYERNYIDVDEAIKEISGTKIRENIKNGDKWKDMVPGGVDERF